MGRARRVGRWLGLLGLVSATALGQPHRRGSLRTMPLRMPPLTLDLRVGEPPSRANRVESPAELLHGLPWAAPRLTLVDVYQAEPFPGLQLILGTVGAMTTSFDGCKELAGVRQQSLATFPGVRLRAPALSPVALGAGLLVALNRAFQADRAWGVFALSGKL